MEKNQTILWKTYLDVNVVMWWIFMNSTLDANLRNVKNSYWRSAGQFFRKQRLISGQTETTGISLIDSQDLMWLSTSLLHSRAHQYATVKVYVFSDSVLCLGRMGDNPIESWKNQVQRYSEKAHGVRVEDLPRTHYSGYLQRDSENDGRITVWSSELHKQDHLHVNVQWYHLGEERKWKNMWRKFKKSWRQKWYGTCSGRSNGSWDRSAEKTLEDFQRIGHQIFRCTSFYERGQLKSKGGGRTTMRFTACDESIQFRRIARRSESCRETCCRGSDGTRNSYSTSYCRSPSQWATERLVEIIWAKIRKTTRRPEGVQIVLRSEAGLNLVEIGQYFYALPESIFIPRIRITSRWRANMCERVDPKQCKIRTRT